jgi:hypothetical protein
MYVFKIKLTCRSSFHLWWTKMNDLKKLTSSQTRIKKYCTSKFDSVGNTQTPIKLYVSSCLSNYNNYYDIKRKVVLIRKLEIKRSVLNLQIRSVQFKCSQVGFDFSF